MAATAPFSKEFEQIQDGCHLQQGGQKEFKECLTFSKVSFAISYPIFDENEEVLRERMKKAGISPENVWSKIQDYIPG